MGKYNYGTRVKLSGEAKQRERVLTRDFYCRCKGCKSCTPAGCTRVSTEDDHIVPISLGGHTETSAEFDVYHQGLCNPCHKVKSNKEALAARWRIKAERAKEAHPGIIGSGAR